MTAIASNLLVNKKKHFDAVRNKHCDKWKVTLKAIKDYRSALLKAQTYLCVYCRMAIVLDEVGYREVEHILPKARNPVKNFKAAKARSNNYDDRKTYTIGYPAFMYEPLNLALSCKHCNACKGSFDPVLDRAVPPVTYPTNSNEFAWVHPHFDVYADHINIKSGFLYEAITPDKGGYVISACGLDKMSGLNARVLDAMVLHTKDICDAMLTIKTTRDRPDLKQAAKHIFELFNVSTAANIETLLRELCMSEGTAAMINVIQKMRVEFGSGEAIYAKAPTTHGVTH